MNKVFLDKKIMEVKNAIIKENEKLFLVSAKAKKIEDEIEEKKLQLDKKAKEFKSQDINLKLEYYFQTQIYDTLYKLFLWYVSISNAIDLSFLSKAIAETKNKIDIILNKLDSSPNNIEFNIFIEEYKNVLIKKADYFQLIRQKAEIKREIQVKTGILNRLETKNNIKDDLQK